VPLLQFFGFDGSDPLPRSQTGSLLICTSPARRRANQLHLWLTKRQTVIVFV
jgi:hypothetical protein